MVLGVALMNFVDVDCAGQTVRVDASLADLSRPRVNLPAFAVEPRGEPVALTLERHRALPQDAGVAEGPMGRCRFVLEGPVLKVEVPEGVFQAELVLRLAWSLVTSRQGGVLLHASAISDGTAALVASGKSGDGKSTLSRWCRRAGLTLLTDEIVQVFPDGTCAGSPFRSDADNVGARGTFPVRAFVALEKAPHEALGPLSASHAALLAASQCFDGSVFALPRLEVHRRLLAFLSRPRLGTLAFRNDAAVGPFVRELLAER